MKITLAAVTVLTGLVATSAANAAVVKFKATLNGAQETPPVTTTSTGTADLDFDDAASTLNGTAEITLEDPATISDAHIHLAECGKAGSIYKGLTVNKNNFNGTIVVDQVKLDPDGVKALNEGRLYLNIHTTKNTAGELRGQIFKDGSGDTCPKTGGSGSDGGSTTTPTDGGGNTSSSSGGTSDAGTNAASSSDDGGCSTSGSSGSSDSSNGVLFGVGIAVAAGALTRRAKRAKQR